MSKTLDNFKESVNITFTRYLLPEVHDVSFQVEGNEIILWLDDDVICFLKNCKHITYSDFPKHVNCAIISSFDYYFNK